MYPNLGPSSLIYFLLYIVVVIGALSEPLQPYKPNRVWQYVTIIFFVLLSGLRYHLGDTETYRLYYDGILDINDFEKGYAFINVLFNTLHFNFMLFLFVITGITGFLIKKSFENRWFFFAMLMILGKLATLYAFSGLRQWIALCICFYAIYLLQKGKWKYFLLVVFIAMQFHRSAMVLFPMALFYGRDFKYRVAFVTVIVAVFIGYSSKEFFQAAGDINPALNLGVYLEDGGNEVGMNAMNWIENFAILIPAIIFRNRLKDKVPNYDFFLYMHLIYCAFLIAGSDFGIIKRLRDYYVTGYFVLVPSFMYLFPPKQRKIYLALAIIYFGLLFFRSLNFYFNVGNYDSILFHLNDV